MIETISPDNSGTGPRQTDEISTETDSYENGRDELFDLVPEGWRIINLRRA